MLSDSHLPAHPNGLAERVDEFVFPEMVDGLAVRLVGQATVVPQGADGVGNVTSSAVVSCGRGDTQEACSSRSNADALAGVETACQHVIPRAARAELTFPKRR